MLVETDGRTCLIDCSSPAIHTIRSKLNDTVLVSGVIITFGLSRVTMSGGTTVGQPLATYSAMIAFI